MTVCFCWAYFRGVANTTFLNKGWIIVLILALLLFILGFHKPWGRKVWVFPLNSFEQQRNKTVSRSLIWSCIPLFHVFLDLSFECGTDYSTSLQCVFDFLQSSDFQKGSWCLTRDCKTWERFKSHLTTEVSLCLQHLFDLEVPWKPRCWCSIELTEAVRCLCYFAVILAGEWSEYQGGDWKLFSWVVVLKRAAEAQLCLGKAVGALWVEVMACHEQCAPTWPCWWHWGSQRHPKERLGCWVGKSARRSLALSSGVCSFQNQGMAAASLLPFIWLVLVCFLRDCCCTLKCRSLTWLLVDQDMVT